MIPLLIWNEDYNVTIDMVRIDAETVQSETKKLNYVSTRTLKGKKNQDWYSSYFAFSISVKNMLTEDFDRLLKIMNNQKYNIKMLMDNISYNIVFEGDTISYDKKWSGLLEQYLYSISFNIEEQTPDIDLNSVMDFIPYNRYQDADEQSVDTYLETIDYKIYLIVKDGFENIGYVSVVLNSGDDFTYDPVDFYEEKILEITIGGAYGADTATIAVFRTSGEEISKVLYTLI